MIRADADRKSLANFEDGRAKQECGWRLIGEMHVTSTCTCVHGRRGRDQRRANGCKIALRQAVIRTIVTTCRDRSDDIMRHWLVFRRCVVRVHRVLSVDRGHFNQIT